jgi:hypothetical protein
VLLLVVAATGSARADADPAQEKLRRSASFACDQLESVKQGRYDVNYVTQALKVSMECAAEADRLLAGGAAATTMIDFAARPGQCDIDSPVSLGEFKDKVCLVEQKRVTQALDVDELGQAASRAAAQLGQLKKNDANFAGRESMLKLLLDEAMACTAAADKALADGVAPATAVEFYTYDSGLTSPTSLADIKGKVCAPAHDAAGGAEKARAAAEEAEYAPYRKALTGDKLKIFMKQKMLNGTNYYTHGGRRLRKPEEFAKADAWYYFVTDRNGITPRWEIEGWLFKGDKNSGMFDQSGPGQTPPSSAFK